MDSLSDVDLAAAASSSSAAPLPSPPRPPAATALGASASAAPRRTLIHFKKNSKHAVSLALAQLGWREVRIKIPHSGGKKAAKGKRNNATAKMAELALAADVGATASSSLPSPSPSPSPDAASSSDDDADNDGDEAAGGCDDPEPSPASRAEPLEHARPKVKQPRTMISNLANFTAVEVSPADPAASSASSEAAAAVSLSAPLSSPPSWDVAWVDLLPDSEYASLGRLHRINQLPQMHKLSKKKFLAMQLNAMAEHEASEYNFYPRSWVLPQQSEEVKAAFAEQTQAASAATAAASTSSSVAVSASSPVLIVKPDFACEGRGIYLVDRFSSIDLERGPLVVQEYIPRPLLLASGRKFDLRIYVLILSVAPLSLALFDDGLTRFCTEAYTAPTAGALGTAFQHLTNYAINKKHESFVLNTAQSLPDEGSKWTIRTLFEKLAEEGRDIPALWRDIADLVVKAVLASYGALSHAYRTAIPAGAVDTDGGSAFQFLGFDVLLTDSPSALNPRAIRPFLIEINRNCSLKCDTPLDARIKVKAVAQALQLVDPRAPYRMQTKAQKDAETRALRGLAGQAYREAQQGKQNQRICARLRYEDELMRSFDGGFQRIYPLEGAATAASVAAAAAASSSDASASSSMDSDAPAAASPSFSSSVRGPLMPLADRAPVYDRLMSLSVRLHAQSLSAKKTTKSAPAKKTGSSRVTVVKSRIATKKTADAAAAGAGQAEPSGES